MTAYQSIPLALPKVIDTESLRVETVPGASLTAEHIAVWRQISSCTTHDNPFFAPEFTLAVAQARSDVYVAVLRDKARISAFLPYQFATPWHRRIRVAERVGGEMSDYFGIIAEPGFRLDAHHLLRVSKLQAIEFTHLDETQAQFGLGGVQSEVGLRIRIDQGGEAYWRKLQQRDKRLVADTDRRERKLIEAHGPLRFELQANDIPAELTRLIAAKRAQYVRTAARDALGNDWSVRLLSILADSHNTHCGGLLSTLFAGDTWVASHFGIRNRHVLHYWFPAYNNDLKAFSPGRLLLKAIIGASDGAGIDVIDRGVGDHPAKQEFANDSHKYSRGLWYLPGPASFCYRAARSLAWRFVRS